MAEMPLALFSTLAPMGAGAFVALAAAFLTTAFDEAQLKKIDRLTVIPVVVVVVGFIAAFFHLASPFHAFGVFAGVGSSPLSNEILAGVVFCAVMLVYWIWALTGKMADGVRKGFAVAVALLGLIFAAFTGLAYGIATIPSWDTPAVPVQMIGFALVGGMALGALVLAAAGAGEALAKSPLKTIVAVLAVVGAVLGIAGFAMQASAASAMENAFYYGADLVAAEMAPAIGGAICLAISAVCTVLALRGKAATGAAAASAILAAVGILCIRVAFYGLQISVGLSLL